MPTRDHSLLSLLLAAVELAVDEVVAGLEVPVLVLASLVAVYAFFAFLEGGPETLVAAAAAGVVAVVGVDELGPALFSVLDTA
jgi:hypothetical protein